MKLKTPSSERQIIQDDYFLTYNPDNSPYDSDRQWTSPDLTYGNRYVIDTWFSMLREQGYSKEDVELKTVLDLGAATGALMDLLKKQHPELDLYGVEGARWAKKNALKRWKKRIHFGDWLDISKEYEDNQFDVIIDCVSQYLHKDNLRYALGEIRRVAKKGVISVVNTLEDGYLDDRYRLINKSDAWWTKQFGKHVEDNVYQSPDGLFIWV